MPRALVTNVPRVLQFVEFVHSSILVDWLHLFCVILTFLEGPSVRAVEQPNKYINLKSAAGGAAKEVYKP